MAASKTLMKGTAGRGIAPSEVLFRVNRELCLENESMMFVTVFCGILNFRTGEVLYSNAGHNPPLLLSKGRAPEPLPLPRVPPRGDGGFHVRNPPGHARPGDMLLLYTDGVTEAMTA